VRGKRARGRGQEGISEADKIRGWSLRLDAIGGNADTVESRARLLRATQPRGTHSSADAISEMRSRGGVPAVRSGRRVAIGRIMPACDNYVGASES
jgi:hypothetical protein